MPISLPDDDRLGTLRRLDHAHPAITLPTQPSFAGPLPMGRNQLRYAARAATGSSRAAGSPPSFGGTRDIARSASAVIVRLGLTPGFAGTAAPSHTSRFSYWKARHSASTTPVCESAPITAPPRMWAVV